MRQVKVEEAKGGNQRARCLVKLMNRVGTFLELEVDLPEGTPRKGDLGLVRECALQGLCPDN